MVIGTTWWTGSLNVIDKLGSTTLQSSSLTENKNMSLLRNLETGCTQIFGLELAFVSEK